MNRFLLGAAAAISAVALAPAANAADFFPGSANFQVSGDITSGTVSAALANSGILAGSFTDRFFFTIDQTGFGSGSISTSASFFEDVTDLDIFSVKINGIDAARTASPDGLYESYFISGVPIVSGVLNTIEVAGLSRGNGSYGGNATFVPSAVPETSTWAMMLVGFGMMGYGLRYRRRTTKVSFA